MAVRKKFLVDFSEICRRFGESISIIKVIDFENAIGFTFFELNRVSDDLSAYFSKFSKADTRYVGVEVSDYFFLPCLLLGIWKSGFSFAGIGNQYTSENTINYLNGLGVQFMITDKDECRFFERNAQIVSSFYVHEKRFFLWRREIETEFEKLRGKWDICYGIMTSGTTDDLKIIQVPWNCILLNVEELTERFGVKESDCIFLSSPCTFDPFFVELFSSLLKGCSLLMVSDVIKLCSYDLMRILFSGNWGDGDSLSLHPSCNHTNIENHFCLDVKRMRSKRITILQMTPSIFKRWNEDCIKNFILCANTSLRVLILGGEKFPEKILKLKCCDNKTKIFNIYGITEISCWAFLHEVTNESSENDVPLGKELKSIVYKINDQNELLIGSPFRICLVNDEKEFHEDQVVFRNTKDVVKLINNKLYFESRSNEIVKKFGIKINLEKIKESFLILNATFTACFCVYDDLNIKLGLFYQGSCTNHGGDVELTSLENFLKKGYFYPEEKLKEIEKPDYLIEIGEIPLNPHGKCDKKKLLKHLRDIHSHQKSNLDLSNLFINIWNNELGLKNPNLNSSNFTELGGNSISALQIINKLEEAGFVVPANFIKELLNGGSRESCLKSLISAAEIASPKRKKRKFIEDASVNNGAVGLSIKWKFDLEKCIDATPTVCQSGGRGMLLVGSHSSKLCCIDIDSGKAIWTVHLGDRIESGVTVSSDGTRGFVGCYDSFVYCLSIVDGSLCWKYKTEDMIKSTPCLSSNEKVVFAASYDRCLYCLSVEDGVLLKRLRLSDKGIFSSGIISVPLGNFYLATLDGTCIALSQIHHEVKWKAKLESPVFASPCLLEEGNRILFAEVVGTVHCLNAIDGTKIWKYSANGFIYSTPVCHRSEEGIDFVVFGCNDESVYCLRNANGIELNWRMELDSSVFSRTCLFSLEGVWTVCAATTKGFVHLCDFSSGSIQTSFKLEGEVFSSPVRDGEKLFVGCRDNNVYALEISKEIQNRIR